MTAYRCILADPPWPERGSGKIKRGADAHYNVLNIPLIAKVMIRSPKWNPAPDCHLWIWSPRQIGQCLAVIEALGFVQKSFVFWAKRGRIGLGQYVRYKGELLLFATKGRTMMSGDKPTNLVWTDDDGLMGQLHGGIGAAEVTTLELARVCDPVTGKVIHSRKPEQFHDVAERVSPGPRLEMFARESKRTGWDFWGDEVAA